VHVNKQTVGCYLFYAGNKEETMNTNSKNLTGIQLVRSMMLFFGSFMFAFILNSYIIHEAGHVLGGMLYGCKIEGFHINPFGTGGWLSQCPNPETMTLKGRFIQGMGGPIIGLPLSIAITLILWRKRSPIWLPLLMSATVVCIGNFLGVLDSIQNYPGHIFDYGWMLYVGVPPFIIWTIGIASLTIGIILMHMLIPLAGIGGTEPFWKILALILSTWPLYFFIRLIYQSLEGKNISGPISVLIFGVILATLISLTFKPVIKVAARFTSTEPFMPSLAAVWLDFGLGVGLTVLLVATNPIWFPQ
jgi:hypothetical protein